VEEVYFPYYSRKWKASTRVNNMNRVRIHLVDGLGKMVFGAFRRDGLQDVLDEKAKSLSFSTVDHLRWDLKQVFDLAMAEGLLVRNPALLLFTPKDAAKPVRKVMNMKEVQMLFGALDQRERLVTKARGHGGNASGRDLRVDLGNLAGVLRRYSAEGLPGDYRLSQNRSIRPQGSSSRRASSGY
jgi:hypothetical protein